MNNNRNLLFALIADLDEIIYSIDDFDPPLCKRELISILNRVEELKPHVDFSLKIRASKKVLYELGCLRSQLNEILKGRTIH